MISVEEIKINEAIDYVYSQIVAHELAALFTSDNELGQDLPWDSRTDEKITMTRALRAMTRTRDLQTHYGVPTRKLVPLAFRFPLKERVAQVLEEILDLLSDLEKKFCIDIRAVRYTAYRGCFCENKLAVMDISDMDDYLHPGEECDVLATTRNPTWRRHQ